MLEAVEFWTFCQRIGLAALCGLLVGLDREFRRKPLGAPAYILIGAASAGWTMVTLNLAVGMSDVDGQISSDPTRVIQGIVSGIGFLGGGAILSRSRRGHLRGVASGAAIWGIGAVGVAAGLGLLREALALTALSVAVLWLDMLFAKAEEQTDLYAERDKDQESS